MRAYILTTGILFGLIVLAHLWRMVAESPSLARDPVYLLLTIASASLSVWAGLLLTRRRSP